MRASWSQSVRISMIFWVWPEVAPLCQNSWRERDCFAELEGAAQRLGIHISEHERLAGLRIHGECGDEAIGIELRRKISAFLDIGFGATWCKCVG
jgi:hypothetical protein